MDINSKTENKTKKNKPQNKIKLKMIFFKVADPPPKKKRNMQSLQRNITLVPKKIPVSHAPLLDVRNDKRLPWLLTGC